MPQSIYIGFMDFDADFSEHTTKISVGSISYKMHRGSGVTVVFIHGLGASSRTWKRLVKYLPDDMGVYLIDLLGHGKSSAPETDYTIPLQMSVVRKVIEENDLHGCYLFGHSYGGWIAASMVQNDGAFKGVVLEDAAGLMEFTESREVQNPEYREELSKNALILNPKPHVIKSIVSSYGIADELTEKSLSRISSRTMVLWGSEDKIIEPKYGEMFQKRIKNSQLQVILGAGHTPHYEMPEVVKKLLVDFVKVK